MRERSRGLSRLSRLLLELMGPLFASGWWLCTIRVGGRASDVKPQVGL